MGPQYPGGLLLLLLDKDALVQCRVQYGLLAGWVRQRLRGVCCMACGWPCQRACQRAY